MVVLALERRRMMVLAVGSEQMVIELETYLNGIRIERELFVETSIGKESRRLKYQDWDI
jgi:hypothetical protein